VPAFRRALSVRPVKAIIVPLIALFLLITLPISVPVFDPATCISSADDVAQVVVVSTTLLSMLLQWSHAAARLPMRTLPVVIFVTLVSVVMIVDWVCYRCSVQHGLEVFNMCIDFLIIFWQVGVI
jgi:hypothetical protein